MGLIRVLTSPVRGAVKVTTAPARFVGSAAAGRLGHDNNSYRRVQQRRVGQQTRSLKRIAETRVVAEDESAFMYERVSPPTLRRDRAQAHAGLAIMITFGCIVGLSLLVITPTLFFVLAAILVPIIVLLVRAGR